MSKHLHVMNVYLWIQVVIFFKQTADMLLEKYCSAAIEENMLEIYLPLRTIWTFAVFDEA